MARIFSIACFAVVAGIFVSAVANEYCEMSCKNPFERRVYKHTMCAYPSPDPGPACVNPSSQGLSDTEKRAIVRRHNELRRRVASGKESRGKTGPQPPAEDMPDLTWDTELETIAQRWTSQCIWEHDKCRNVKRFERVGQNMAYTGVSGENKDSVTDDLVQQWYDEVDDFDRRVIPNYQSTGEFVNHYVQMVWAETKKIGCGRIKYDESGYNRQVLICNYAPGGNMFGQPIYKIKS